jgi:hypothetical protein
MVAKYPISNNNLKIDLVPTHLSARCGNNYQLVQQFCYFPLLVVRLKAFLETMVGENVRS